MAPALQPVTVFCSADCPQVDFAIAEIERAAIAKCIPCARRPLDLWAAPVPGLRVALAASQEQSARVTGALGLEPAAPTAPQSYALRVVHDDPPAIAVLAADPVGAMYGGLDVAEAIAAGALAELADADVEPHILRRGIKFNIPLDARTPSYSDASDSAQHNIPEVWRMDFWHDYLDQLARCRFNVLSLWNLHPFPSMVKVPEFPDVALDDVMRTRTPFDDSYSLCGHDMVRPETLDALETVVTMTIDEKIDFWRRVMQYARDRGIEVYIFTWNIFTFGADGHHGITHEQDNPRTITYFRASVRAMVLTYPLLAGLGITAGERMDERDDSFTKEKWLWQAYGQGVADALRVQPDRQFRMIHRFHQTALTSILDEWAEYPGPFDLSFKYAIAQMYSDPAPPFARQALAELPRHMRMWMTVRNDDIYSFRWGDPDFVRAFVLALPGPDQLAGYYMGPDGYTWGREFLSTQPQSPRQLVVHKQWYTFMLWGRLSYNPRLTDAHFKRLLAERFVGADPAALFDALREASRIIPLVNRCHWEDLDFEWFPEACTSRRSFKGFHTVQHFMNGRTMPESNLWSVKEYVAALPEDAREKTSPPQAAQMLRDHAAAARKLAASIPQGDDRELRETLGDIVAMAHLGDYYAAKLDGAVHLHRFDRTGDAAHQLAAITMLQRALGHWQDCAAAYATQYVPQLLTRIGYVDVTALTAKVREDVDAARRWTPRTP